MNETSESNSPWQTEPFFNGTDMSQALREQSSAWLKAQSTIADAMQSMMSSWVQWRQEDAQAALQALQQIATSRDPAGVVSAYSAWFAGTVERRKIELGSAKDEALRLATIGQQSMRSLSLNEAGRLRATSGAMAHSKPATKNAQQHPLAKSHSETPKHAASG
jgi:hypothetical protein